MSALVAAIVVFAIGVSVLLREPRRRSHVLFATFAFNIALWSALSFVAKQRINASAFDWASLLVAVSLPATAQRFFQAFLGDEAGPPPLSRSTVVGAVAFYTVLCFSKFIEPIHGAPWFRAAFMGYVFAGLYLSVFYLYRRYRETPSRIEKTRLLYLVVGGFATVTSALVEVIPRGPSFGNVFIIVYLYFLSQNLVRYRLLDLNELLGRMVVLGTLVFILTLIYGVLVRWVVPDEQGPFFFNTLLASATIVILIEPMRTRVEGAISRWMFQEKFELSRRIEMLRAEMANVIDMRVLVPRVLSALEDSRRITHAAIYLADPDGSGFDLAGHVGPRPEARFDAIAHRPFFERLRKAGAISQEGIEREVAARRPASAEELESLHLMLRALDQMNGSVALGFSSEDQLLGVLVIRDDRLREAYSSDEIELFRGVATSLGITLQNSQVYERMKERDRLAALGQMAAGLAHEIRNPLGSIKGAAQFLQPGQNSEGSREGTGEFLGIIVEEVNRLNKIVSQFLDYARPYRGEQRPLEVSDVLKKTHVAVREGDRGERQGRHRDRVRGQDAPRSGRRRAAPPGLLEPVAQRAAGDAAGGAAGHLDGAAASHPAWRRGRVPRGPVSRHRGRHSARGPQEPVHPVFHHQGEGDRAWGCPSASASSKTTAGPSRSARRRVKGRPSRCCCPSRPTCMPPIPTRCGSKGRGPPSRPARVHPRSAAARRPGAAAAHPGDRPPFAGLPRPRRAGGHAKMSRP